jgi:hypothetical protein
MRDSALHIMRNPLRDKTYYLFLVSSYLHFISYSYDFFQGRCEGFTSTFRFIFRLVKTKPEVLSLKGTKPLTCIYE